MSTFTSVNRKFMIIGKPIGGIPEYLVRFEPIGVSGSFSTEDEDLALKLRSHPEFGKKFVELGTKPKQQNNIVSGVRGSTDHPELGENKEQDPKKLIEFGRLQATLLKQDGTFRKDASEENKLKYEALKKELGELE